MFQLKDILRMAADGVDGSSTTTSADVAELEAEVEEVKDDETEKGDDDVEPQESDEDTEGDEEEEEQPEPVAELHPFDRPSLKSINEAYPDFFKKFPAMRDMYFREAEYSRLFPTIDDAKEANENNVAFMNLRDDIFTGTGEKFLSAIKTQNPQSLQRFSGKILGTLARVDQDSFWRAANPLVEDVARSMFKKGVAESNENLANAAKYLAHYFFGDADIAEGKKTTIVQEPQETDVSKERKAWDDERHTEFRNSVEKDLRGQLNDLIIGLDAKTGKSKIDPDDVLSPFVRNSIIERVLKDIGDTLQADKTHLSYMDSLWGRAKQNGRTDTDKARLISAYLARARQLAPSLRSKYVSEAMGKKVRDATQKRVKLASVGDKMPANGRVSGSGSKSYNPKSIDYRKTSDFDILNDDIKYRN